MRHWEKYGVAADIALDVNKTFYTSMVRAHIRIQQLFYNKNENLSKFMTLTASSSILMSQYRELLLQWMRMYNPEIFGVTGNQRLHRLRVHGVELDMYSRQPNGMEKMKAEIETGSDNIIQT